MAIFSAEPIPSLALRDRSKMIITGYQSIARRRNARNFLSFVAPQRIAFGVGATWRKFCTTFAQIAMIMQLFT